MEIHKSAESIIVRATESFRELAAEAALSGGPTEDVTRLMGTVDALEDIRRIYDEATSQSAEKGEVRNGGTSVRTAVLSEPRPQYPRFEAEDDTLAKIGWSKKKSAEYVHRTPWATVLVIARHLADLGAGGLPIRIADSIPMKDSRGDVIPSYQVYAVTSFLHKTGRLQKRGDSYVPARANDLKTLTIKELKRRMRTTQ